MKNQRLLSVAALCAAAAVGLQAPGDAFQKLRQGFQQPPDDARIMVRWWWFGPAVTKPHLDRELAAMKQAGIGGVEVQPVYPLSVDDPGAGIRNLPYLSPEFLAMLRHAADQAAAQGLRFDLTLGTGWPYGGPHVPITQAAARLRVERIAHKGGRRVPLPEIGSGERLLAVFAGNPSARVQEIRDGAAWLPAGSSGPGEVLCFIASRTGMMVKRASAGGEGFVLDHYDPAALATHLDAVGTPMLRALGPRAPHAIFCDSLESFGSDWTADLPTEFQKRRGYDLIAHLPDLAGNGESSAAVRHDWGRTLTELVNERFLAPAQEWARRHQTRFRVQAYGIPPAALSSAAGVDLPEGEGANWRILTSARWASSAGRIYGKPVTSSETWTWLHSPSFRATPLDFKAEADLHFLQGINQLIGHGWPYSPPEAGYPGWRFYAAAVLNPNNPWWGVMPDMSAYLQRISFLMRQGDPVTDVGIYLPTDDAWAGLVPGRVNLYEALRDRVGQNLLGRVLDAGLNADFFDDGALEQAKFEKGAMLLGRSRYRAIILPGVETISPAAYRKLEQFAAAGGVLIATRRTPGSAPGLKATATEHGAVRELSRKLFEGGAGRLAPAESADLTALLRERVTPDAGLAPAIPGFGFQHRHTGDGEVYFVVNTGNTPVHSAAAFRVTGMQAEWWDPFTGRSSPAQIDGRGASATTVTLDLEPYGSRVLVFSKSAAPAPAKLAQPARELPLDAAWTVSFGGGEPRKLASLHSWSDDEETRHFSGEAAYETTFQAPADVAGATVLRLTFGEGKPVPQTPRRNGMRTWLDGPVRDGAVVYLNGKRAGSVWCPPYALEVTGMVTPGENRLRIVVGNTAMNAMAGRPLPNYRLLNSRYGTRFEPQDMDAVQPLPSGLLGPVRLVVTLAPGGQRSSE